MRLVVRPSDLNVAPQSRKCGSNGADLVTPANSLSPEAKLQHQNSRRLKFVVVCIPKFGERGTGAGAIFVIRRIEQRHRLSLTRDVDDSTALPAPAISEWLCTCCAHELSSVSSLKTKTPVTGGFPSGRYWARTSDPQLVELVLSQLS